MFFMGGSLIIIDRVACADVHLVKSLEWVPKEGKKNKKLNNFLITNSKFLIPCWVVL